MGSQQSLLADIFQFDVPQIKVELDVFTRKVYVLEDESLRANTQNMCLLPGVSGWFSVLPSLCGCVGIRLGIWGRNRWRYPIVSGLVLVV